MVLRANTVAESRRVDWLSKVPCVSISSTATCGAQSSCQHPQHLHPGKPISCATG